MRDAKRITEYRYAGPLSEVITSLVDQKRALGYIYNSEVMYLSKIDQLFSNMNSGKNRLTKEMVECWSKRGDGEALKTWQNRVIVIKHLALFMECEGYDAYVTPTKLTGQASAFVPHIFTSDELRRIFEYADTTMSYTNCPNRTAVSSLLFRVLYGCGLRISEALNLKCKDVDLENGVLTILSGKNDVDRIVPMTNDLTFRCKTYVDKIHRFSNSSNYFFLSPHGERYSHDAIWSIFHQILMRSGIPYRGKGKGPRLHDSRHTFAVNCLKKWVYEGVDINAALPVLSAYLGHKGISATQTYLRLTADLFPDITQLLESNLGNVIPHWEGAYETE